MLKLSSLNNLMLHTLCPVISFHRIPNKMVFFVDTASYSKGPVMVTISPLRKVPIEGLSVVGFVLTVTLVVALTFDLF